MALVDMKRTKKDRKAEQERYKTLGSPDGDAYHHGLTVHLDHESLQKLGIDQMPKPGDTFQVHAHGHVKSSEEEHRDDGEPRRRMTLELRKMGLDAAKQSETGNVQDPLTKGAKSVLDAALGEQSAAKKKR